MGKYATNFVLALVILSTVSDIVVEGAKKSKKQKYVPVEEDYVDYEGDESIVPESKPLDGESQLKDQCESNRADIF
jgi:hypothetical protein